MPNESDTIKRFRKMLYMPEGMNEKIKKELRSYENVNAWICRLIDSALEARERERDK